MCLRGQSETHLNFKFGEGVNPILNDRMALEVNQIQRFFFQLECGQITVGIYLGPDDITIGTDMNYLNTF